MMFVVIPFWAQLVASSIGASRMPQIIDHDRISDAFSNDRRGFAFVATTKFVMFLIHPSQCAPVIAS